MNVIVPLPPEPAFKVGDQVCRNSTGATGTVTEVKCWKGSGKISYRVDGEEFHPRQYFNQSILSVAPSPLEVPHD